MNETPLLKQRIFHYQLFPYMQYQHAFLKDQVQSLLHRLLQNQGLQDKVLVVTTSEFGRRVYENGSFGTDHGTSAPCLLFGSSIVPEIFGTNPDLTNLNNNNNMQIQFDFRQVYASLIKDWFGLPESIIQSVFGNSFESIPFVQEPLSIEPPNLPNNFKMYPAFPNPFNPKTSVNFELSKISNVVIRVIDQNGKLVNKKYLGRMQIGNHKFNLNAKNWASGMYFVQLEVSGKILSQKISLLK